VKKNEKSKASKKKKIATVNPKLNFVLNTYYKETALETVQKKLEKNLDAAPETENDINKI